MDGHTNTERTKSKVSFHVARSVWEFILCSQESPDSKAPLQVGFSFSPFSPCRLVKIVMVLAAIGAIGELAQFLIALSNDDQVSSSVQVRSRLGAQRRAANTNYLRETIHRSAVASVLIPTPQSPLRNYNVS